MYQKKDQISCPQRPTIPKTNHLHPNLNGIKGSNGEEESESDNSDHSKTEYDIKYRICDGEETLPPPTVSFLRIQNVGVPKINHGKVTGKIHSWVI